jgi:hypothetical protein
MCLSPRHKAWGPSGLPTSGRAVVRGMAGQQGPFGHELVTRPAIAQVVGLPQACRIL